MEVINNLIDTYCPICGENQQITELYPANFNEKSLTPEVFSARRTTEHYHYKIVRCKCGMIFSNPILPEETINRLYSASDLTYDKELDNITESYYRVFKSAFKGNLKESSILEFGCGNGFLLKRLLDEGAKGVAGIEPGESVVDMADSKIKPYLKVGFFEDYYKDEKEIFDVICSFQTLDHVRDPLGVLEKSFRLCKPGGICLFVTHDTNGLQAKILKDKSPIIDIEHIYLFNKTTLSQLVVKAGFSSANVQDVINTYSLKYWTRMLPMPAVLKDNLVKAQELTGLDKTNIGLKAGNIAVIGYKKPK